MTIDYSPRRLTRSLAPALEPVSLEEAKHFLRVDGTADDALIGDMISAARIVAEEQTGKSFITQQWQVHYDECPPPVVPLPHGPVQAIASVSTVDETGQESTFSSGLYYLNALQELVFETVPYGHHVTIEYIAGFGDMAADVPTHLAQAILLHVAHLYEHRDSMAPPLASQLSYSQYREIRL